MSNKNNKVQLTQDGHDKLIKELDELNQVKLPKVIGRLEEARAMGDLSENSAYTDAQQELDLTKGRIAELEDILNQSEIVTVSQSTTLNKVDIGCKVTVSDGKAEKQFTLVGELEADLATSKLPHTSPIGKALIGKKVGQTVEVKVPVGKINYKIISIDRG